MIKNRITTKKCLVGAVFALALLIFASANTSADWEYAWDAFTFDGDFWSGGLENPTVATWYPISDNDIVECRSHTGYKTEEDVGGGTHWTTDVSFSVSIQAQRTKLIRDLWIYEVAWYFQPASGSKEYTIEIEGYTDWTTDNAEGEHRSADYLSGDEGYDAFLINTTNPATHEPDDNLYTVAKLKWDDKELPVKIVIIKLE